MINLASLAQQGVWKVYWCAFPRLNSNDDWWFLLGLHIKHAKQAIIQINNNQRQHKEELLILKVLSSFHFAFSSLPIMPSLLWFLLLFCHLCFYRKIYKTIIEFKNIRRSTDYFPPPLTSYIPIFRSESSSEVMLKEGVLLSWMFSRDVSSSKNEIIYTFVTIYYNHN